MKETQSLLPRHVVVIPDGNRRWAHERALPTFAGHKQGFERALEVANHAQALGLTALTLWGFSTENWNRSDEEVSYLMEKIFITLIEKTWQSLADKGVRMRFAGQLDRLPHKLQKLVRKVTSTTEQNTGMTMTLCLSYGGRDELMRAFSKMLAAGIKPDEVTEELVSSYLDTAGLPDVDLIIRTSGEQRLSGIFPWQSVYSELYFTPLFFPDFSAEEFDKALAWFGARGRRFGK